MNVQVIFGIFLLSVLTFLASKPNNEALGEKGIFRVTVDLKNVSDNIGTFSVHIKVDGQQILKQSRVVDNSSQSQICPDDIESPCYKSETLLFPADSIPVGSEVRVCVEETISHIQSCTRGENRSENAPEVVSIEIPDKLEE